MKINVTNPNADTLWKMFGISKERSEQLFEHMDLCLNYHCKRNKPMLFSVADLQQSIAEICQNPEELIFCIFANTAYLSEEGMLTADPVNYKLN